MTFEKLLELCWIDTGHWYVGTDPVHHQREQQEHKPTTEIAELAGLC